MAEAQNITNTANGTLTTVIPWTLTPTSTTTPATVTTQFRLRCSNNNGYKVTAAATFSVTDSAPVSGGADIAATDIGLGITSIVAASGVTLPRADVIHTGFNYNPGAVVGTNGLSVYTGMAAGEATISDLAASQEILNGNKIATTTTVTSGTNYLTVTLTFGAVPQFFTPATFSSVVTLTIANGP
jgi:hypothetical protein